MKSACAVFLLAFGLYVATMAPALAPYRDTGEMCVAGRTLGVAHPTSYPVYVQLGHIAQALPLGNRAYRLNLLSALCGALAVAALFGFSRRRWGWEAGAAAALLLGLNATFWSVVQVQEMYSLWVLMALAVMHLARRLGEAYSERGWLFFALAFGFCLGNRLDLVLWAPGLLWLALGRRQQGMTRAVSLWAGLCFLVFPAAMVGAGSNFPIVVLIAGTALWLGPRPGLARWAALSGLFGALGLAVYLYLPVRSASAPYLDWNHPSVLGNFLESILRSRYGGTLDLLSKNYAKGELFGENLALYGRHLWENFSVVGLAAVLAGSLLALRLDPRRWLGLSAAWWWSGPVFLFMANLPPNPHAAAIVEPHYLLSDLVLVLWAAEGFGGLAAWARLQPRPASWRALSWAACALLLLVPLARGRLGRMDRRGHLFSYDYAKNVLRGVFPGGAVAAKKDVQLYTLWHYQAVQGWRPDVRVVSQGLAGSAWYQADKRRSEPGSYVGPLRDAESWRRFTALAAPAAATMDSEVPPELLPSARARGLLRSWTPADPAGEAAVWELLVRRGRYEYEGQPDFFTSDLVGNYSQAAYDRGRQLAALPGAGERSPSPEGAGVLDLAAACFMQAWVWQWSNAEPAAFLGFLAFQAGRYEEAGRYYAWAAQLDGEIMKLAEAYRSLPELKAGVRRATADAFMQLGVVSERLKDHAAAEAHYRAALSLFPTAQTRYNLAVLFWTRDPARAEQELLEALRLDPNHPEASRYLAVLRSRRAAPAPQR